MLLDDGRCNEPISAVETVRTGVAVLTANVLDRSDRRLTAHCGRLVRTARSSERRALSQIARGVARLEVAQRHGLAIAARRVDAAAAQVRVLDPALALARGWSITRDSDGQVVRSAADVGAGDVVTTQLVDGILTSTINARTQQAKYRTQHQERDFRGDHMNDIQPEHDDDDNGETATAAAAATANDRDDETGGTTTAETTSDGKTATAAWGGDETIGYADAMDELEQILGDLEGDDLDVDMLAARVERASFLIGLCRKRIGAARVQVERVVANLDSEDEAEDD